MNASDKTIGHMLDLIIGQQSVQGQCYLMSKVGIGMGIT